jgi:hypothetical protein
MTICNQVDQDQAWGAYGFRITGLTEAPKHLHPVPASWPELRLALTSGVSPRSDPPGTGTLDGDHASVTILGGDRLEVDREPLTVRMLTNRPLTTDAILHPYLGVPATIAARWLGRLSLHGGAFVHDARAWALLGEREAGKSATLAHLLRRGIQVLSDDVLVFDGADVFAGPRSIDLRSDAAEVEGGESLGVVGGRERWRLRPGATAAAVPLSGFVLLEWGDEVALEPLTAENRFATMTASCAFRPEPRDALALLALAALPMWRFTRPPAIDGLQAVVDQLLAGLTSQA